MDDAELMAMAAEAAPVRHAAVASEATYERSAVPASDETVERAFRYVCEEMPPSIQEQNGSAACLAVIRCARDGFGLSAEQTEALANRWNSVRAKPPWSPRELRHKLRSVEATLPTRPPGWLNHAGEFDGVRPDRPAARAGIVLRTHGDRMRDRWEPRPELVDGLIPADGLAAFVALPGVGKSITLMELARCVGTGEPFAGRATRRGRVIYACPDSPASTERRAMALGGAADSVLTVVDLPPLPGGLPALRAAIEKHNAANEGDPIRLLIVDTWDASREHADGGYAGQDGLAENIMRGLRHIASDLQLAVVVAHHATRADNGRARGSVVFDARADAIVIVEQDSPGTVRLRAIKNRDGECGPLGLFHIESADVNGQSVPVLRWGGTAAAAQSEDDDRAVAMLRWIVQHPEQATARGIKAGMGLTSGSTLTRTADELRARGWIEPGSFRPTDEGRAQIEEEVDL